MKKLRTHILKVTILGLLAAGLTGCSDLFTNDVVDCGPEEVTKSSSYIQFSLAQASTTGIGTRGTRAGNPTGGELGDGTEKGQSYENVVTSAVLFLYPVDATNPTDVNSTDPSTRVTMVEFDNLTEASYNEQAYDYIAVSTEPQKVDLDKGTYRVLAIANPRDLTWARRRGNALNLGDVRDHIETEAWSETTATDGTTTYSNFLMTSENDKKGSIIELANNPYSKPATTFVEVERMAARVDYQASGTFTIVQDSVNSVPDTYVGATVEITGAAIVNNLIAGSYELKRTNTGYQTEVTYLGDELVDADGLPTNYVVDPWTDVKDGQTKSVTIDGYTHEVSDLYGVYYPGQATSGDEQNPKFWADLVTAGTTIQDGNDTWHIVGYTMENTTYADYTSKQYNTGAVFAATFTPADGTVRNSFYTGYNFVYGTSTFFRWNNILYATAEDMMAVAYPSSSTSTTPAFTADDRFGATTFESITTIDELTTFIATLRNDDPTGYKAYLQSFTELPNDMTSLYWVNYMSTVCGYAFNNGVTISETTRAVLAAVTDGEVSTYENSQCYYTWWIRHSNDDSDETNGVMEYAIVRNNIYKLRVSSVYSIGGDIPQEGLRIHVYVKDWTMLAEEVIDL